jgi:hypothetical protein
MNTRIFCLGNELVCDDGVAIRLGRILITWRGRLGIPGLLHRSYTLPPELGEDGGGGLERRRKNAIRGGGPRVT